MKKWFKRICGLLLILCMVTFVSLPAAADLGGFSGDSDYGYDYDYDYDDYDYDYGYDDDDDCIFFGSDFGDGGLSSGGDNVFLGTVIVIIIVLYLIMKNAKKIKNTNGGASRPVHIPTQEQNRNLKSIGEYSNLDPNFNGGDLREKISNLYVQMQNAWQDKDLDSLRPYFTDALFAQLERQVDALRRNGQTNYVERIAVVGVVLNGYYQSGGDDHIVATVNARIVDYTVDDKTGALISGSKTAEKFMTYEWDLTRPTGQTTDPEGEMKVVNCPNCGAPLNINQTAKCEYCDSVITVDKHDFVLSSIKGLMQRTNR